MIFVARDALSCLLEKRVGRARSHSPFEPGNIPAGCVPMTLPFSPQIEGPRFSGGFPFPMAISVREYLTTDVDLSGLRDRVLLFTFIT
jgi:hypothetical protein